MEADWEFEIGVDAPVIDASWPGLVDLRWEDSSLPSDSVRHAVAQIGETVAFPGLADVLIQLNGPLSPVWTSKCDFWPALDAAEFDADELDAPSGQAGHAMGCYIDMLARGDARWKDQHAAADACKLLCSRLRGVALRSVRVDLMVRRAVLCADRVETGITGYFTACGGDAAQAAQALGAVLSVFADKLCTQETLQ